MALKTAKVNINNVWYDLTYNEAIDKWERFITAPAITSFHQSDKYYPAIIEAVSSSDITATATSQLFVRERISPTINILNYGDDVDILENHPLIKFELRDEIEGSGINVDSFSLNINGIKQNEIFTLKKVENGYNGTFIALNPFELGSNEISIYIQDNDENENIKWLWFAPFLIYDRTWSDVLFASENRNLSFLKGAQNFIDWSRLTKNMYRIADILTEYGYSVTMTCKYIWNYYDKPTPSQLTHIREDMELLREAISHMPIAPGTAIMPDTPELPFNWYEKINDLERILYIMYYIIENRLISELRYNGEYYLGE